ncbi:MAG TPA: type I phosphomannose isomerase catalytic subunit [Methylomirabilota bacterium]|nr:type I phosphomannose isomerase catalytic subunit [Methylomirabilota bacterium]
MLPPLIFQPLFKERVWGGRNIERLYGKPLPPGRPIGESWEISDRPGDESVVSRGPLAGQSLRTLMEQHGAEILGRPIAPGERFPLLLKILDAQEKLSLQVHPSPASAARLGGEPKTELWFITDTAPGADLYVGLKAGVTRADFEARLKDGSVAECFHRIAVQPGDVMFLPSGRVHAIGAGNVLFEIQQNSDTTYRVFDWNRVGLDGRPRDLHIPQSLESIDFADFEPALITSKYSRNPTFAVRYLVDCPLFRVDACKVKRGGRFHLRSERWQILGVIKGRLEVAGAGTQLLLQAGDFCLVPACLGHTALRADSAVEFLHIQDGAA